MVTDAPHCRTSRHNRTTVVSMVGVLVTGCIPLPPPPADNGGLTYANTTDPTNNGATYVGGDACRACHAELSEVQRIHGHGFVLTPVEGEPPQFPQEATRAGVPDPPEGFDWSQIAYLIGGYIRQARYIDQEGYILVTGVEGVPTQWNLSFPANGTTPGFVDYDLQATDRKPYDFSCFRCHTTGPRPQDEDSPQWQEGRPGFIGTWEEAGVQCEACHGPGSNHIPNPSARDLFVDSSASNCGRCHSRGSDPNVILANDGFIQHYQQWPELLGSGPHATFNCTTCHDPHRSANYDRDNAIRNECRVCHAEQSMAIHEGRVFTRGDYSEPLGCESCHMPYATRSASAATQAVMDGVGRTGDMRTHIFRINPQGVSFTQMFQPDGQAVAKDEAGRAAVSLDFVCLRCHDGRGNAPIIGNMDIVSEIATGIHGKHLSEKSARPSLRIRHGNGSQDGDSAIPLRGW